MLSLGMFAALALAMTSFSLLFGVGIRAAAFAHGDGDLAADLGEYLAALRVGSFFLVLDGRPFIVS